MKRILTVLICICMVMGLAACASKQPGASTPESSAENSNIVDPNEEMFTIETDYAQLQYPLKWQDQVQIDVSAEKVCFSVKDEDVKLFDLCFGGEEGYVFGTLKGENPVELRVVTYDIDENLERFDDYCAMQDDMNVIFQLLIDSGELKAD